MRDNNDLSPVISGIGITTAIGQGRTAVTEALLKGDSAFGVMQRPGRQQASSFLGAEIGGISFSQRLSKKLLRAASFTGMIAMTTLDEAWQDAGLDQADPDRIGLIIGGSNIQQRDIYQTYSKYAHRPEAITPTYAISFMDNDLCGLCTEQFGIKGPAYTIGAASASGQIAIIQAIHAVRSGVVDICIAIGALMDLSCLELQAFKSLGVMGSARFASAPSEACRPYDRDRDGFIFGESCGAVVIETARTANLRSIQPRALVSGWSISMDANRNPNPSYDGECKVIRQALKSSGIDSMEIDYINPHASGSIIGDETELRAIRDCKLSHSYINTTKSILGHGLTAAGAVEVIVTLLQMEAGALHPCLNLVHPISPELKMVTGGPMKHEVQKALCLSFGFGGTNSALVLERT